MRSALITLALAVPVPGTTALAQEPDPPALALPERPGGVDALAEMLSVESPRDLPGSAELGTLEEPRESLIWLASHHDDDRVRTRALRMLQFYPDRAVGELLAGIAADPRIDAATHSAALDGLGGQPLEEFPEWQRLLEAGLRDDDARVRRAAVMALATYPAGVAFLQGAVDDATLHDDVRAVIRGVYGP